MHGAKLSRWTMCYFAAACAFLICGQAMFAMGYGYPATSLTSPDTLAVVHVIVIGWLGLLMAGALLQFVPVLIAKPLKWDHLALPALLFLIVGLIALVGGFSALAGGFLPVGLLSAGAILLTFGFGLIIIMLAATLFQSQPMPVPAQFVAAGLASLAMTALLGSLFAVVLSGMSENRLLLNLVGSGVGLHAALGLGGWLNFTAFGVSYRLLAMFMLAPDDERVTTRLVLWSGMLALLLVAACILLVELMPQALNVAFSTAGLLGAIAIILYSRDVAAMYSRRRRKSVELNIYASLAAFAMLLLSGGLIVVSGLQDWRSPLLAAAIYLFGFGWLTGLGLAQLYKIIPFMTWLECYGPLLGRGQVPRVQDLVNERRSRKWFGAYYTAVVVASTALLVAQEPLFRFALMAQLIATTALLFEFIGARRLSFISRTLHPTADRLRPHLFLPTCIQRGEK